MSASHDRRGFFDALVRRPVMLSVLLASLVVIGLISYQRIPVQMMPDGMVEPGLWIAAANPGASAQENEQKVARILEEEIRTLAGIENVWSSSRDNFVNLQVEFNARMPMDIAKAEVRDRIERARPKLPSSVREVQVFSWSQSDMPVMFFAMLHPGDSAETDALIDNVIQRRIEAVDGVGQVELWGVLDDSIRILLDEDRVRALDLDLGELITRLSKDNFALPMGEVTDGGRRVLLRSDMHFKSVAEIERYPIGRGLVVGDVGRVIQAKSVRNRLFRIDGSYAYYGEVKKEAQANVVETCERLRATLDELEKNPRLQGKFQFLPLFDQGEFIESSLAQMTETAYYGGFFAVAVLFVFLWRIRTTLAVALAIPISVLFTIAWQYLTGGSFNVLTMTGITLALGMLVDNAIVVVENIVRVRNLGVDGKTAAAVGAREVGLAVLLATLTSVVVFMPLIFMTENPQLALIFGELGLPLCTSLLFSLVVALVFLPVVAARILGPRPRWLEAVAQRTAPIGALPARGISWLIGGVRWILRGLVIVLHAAVGAAVRGLHPLRWPLAIAVAAFAAWRAWIAHGAAPPIDAYVELTGAGQKPLQTAIAVGALALAVAASVLLWRLPIWRRTLGPRPVAPTGLVPNSRSVIDLVVGGNHRLVEWSLAHRGWATLFAVLAGFSVIIPRSRMSIAPFGEDEDNARLSFEVTLEDNFTLAEAEQELIRYERFFEGQRASWGFEHVANRFDRMNARMTLYWESAMSPKRLEELRREALEKMPRFPGHRVRMRGDDSTDSKNKNQVVFRLQGPDSDVLEELSTQAIAILDQVPGLHSVGTTREASEPEVRVKFDSDRAQSFDLSPMTAFENIAWALRGWSLPRFHEPGREIPLIIEYDDDAVEGLGTLRDMLVQTQSTGVPLSAFSEIEFAKGSQEIERLNGQTSYTLLGRVDNPLEQQRVSKAGYDALRRDLELPRGYSVGENDLVAARAESEMRDINAALMLSLVLVFLLMGILFESFLLPISVMFTIPYAIVGAFWGLYLTGTTMDSVGWIGIIILVGVVVNNGIVLIDRIHQLRAEGLERTAAVIEGCGNRVRPVLMTALTTLFGLIPTILAAPPSQGIDYRALSTCVAGGLTISTIFTLWVVPLAYTLVDDFAQAVNARLRWAFASRRKPVVEVARPEPS